MATISQWVAASNIRWGFDKEDRLSLNLVEKILFDSGSALVKKDGKKVLDRVAEILKKVQDKQIRIE